MFWEIFLFEIKYRLKRPDTYLYFLVFFIVAFLSFANGAVPASYKMYVNAPLVLTKYYTIFSLFMMVVTAAIMGAPIYRDIEYNTHQYYLSYPITSSGYFWGRFLGSFLFIVIIGSSLIWGSFLGTLAGPALGWLPVSRVGPNHVMNYLQPFLAYMLPNLFLTSIIFFGLVAHTRNVKSIYSGGVILYLAYMMSIFILHNVQNKTIVYLLDAFAWTPMDLEQRFFSPEQQNTSFILLHGRILMNRLFWTALGCAILLITYSRFSFDRFFTSPNGKKNLAEATTTKAGFLKAIPSVISRFKDGYNRRVMYTLARIEWLSIIRDGYFRLIMAVGTLFLGFIFWMGFMRRYNVGDLPRTVVLMDIYNHNFLLFIFMIILFYTGETVHRERATGFAIINDVLPPADWVLYASKLVALFLLACLLATIPLVAGLVIQISKGFYTFNLPAYIAACYGISLPLFVEMIMFAFAVHVLVNNKFAAHAVALIIWVLMLLADSTGYFNYKLLLYSYTPDYILSDMDGVGPSATPIFWFNVYWLFFGGLLLVLAAVFYYRGVLASFSERKRLAFHRLNATTRLAAALLFAGFLLTGLYNYYNVSYINSYLTGKERELRAVAFERNLKQYDGLPLPGVVNLKVFEDIFPNEREVVTKAFATIVNKTGQPIRRLLFDGDELTSYSIKFHGEELPYSNPLVYERPKYSLFKPAHDTSMYRLYQFRHPLNPGDTAVLEISSTKTNLGFSNNMDDINILHNGTAFNGALPGLGYDGDEELKGNEKRKDYGLPEREEEYSAHNDSTGINRLLFSDIPDMVRFEATVSTAGDQVAIAPGNLQKQWKSNGRNYFYYVQDSPKTYFPFPVFSAKYSIMRDTVKVCGNKPVAIEVYHNPEQTVNLNRFVSAFKDGLKFFSASFGTYQFKEMRLLEVSAFHNEASFANSVAYGENYAWSADFNNPDQFDYCYFFTAFNLGHQWWMYQVAPNHTLGSNNIADGLSKYGAFLLYEKKYGSGDLKGFVDGEINYYLFRHGFSFEKENPLINSRQSYVWDTKAGLVLYGLKDLIGEANLNAALHEFRDAYAFREKPPYASSHDLYRFIKKHVPDSLQYYLTDSWEKITVYDNKLLDATATPIGNSGTFNIHIRVHAGKTYTGSDGQEKPSAQMNDYIDIGVFAANNKTKTGRTQVNALYLKKHKLGPGDHDINIIVKGKPASVGIDPYFKLIDRVREDNFKSL